MSKVTEDEKELVKEYYRKKYREGKITKEHMEAQIRAVDEYFDKMPYSVVRYWILKAKRELEKE